MTYHHIPSHPVMDIYAEYLERHNFKERHGEYRRLIKESRKYLADVGAIERELKERGETWKIDRVNDGTIYVEDLCVALESFLDVRDVAQEREVSA